MLMASGSKRHLRAAGFLLPFVLVASAHGQADKPVIAVFDIEDRGVGLSDEIRLRLSDYLAMRLAATGAYQIVPRDKLKERLTQQKTSSYKQCYAESCQIDIGRELAAQKSLATSIMKLGSVCMVTSVMYDLRKSASEGGASVEGGCTEDSIVSSIKELVTKLVPGSKVVSPKATRPRDRGGILIKTRPKGAAVKIDGVDVAGVTPLTVTDLAPGEHLLEISKDDYRYAGKIKVKADDYVTVDRVLQKAEVQLEVVSVPPEATILLNGMEMGKTPKILPSVKAGEHVIELRRKGYLPARQPLRLGAGTTRQSINLSLKKASFIVVSSDPAGAKIEVDGVAAGTTPARVPVAPGKHTLRVAHPSREPANRTVEVSDGKDTVVALRLDLNPEEKERLAAAETRERERTQGEVRYQAELRAHEDRYGSQIQARRTKSILAYSSLAAGGALVVAAGVLYGLGVSQGSDAHESYEEATDSAPPGDLDALDRNRSDIESARTKMTVGTVLLALGVAGIGYSVYQLVTRPSVPEAPRRDIPVSLGLGPSAAGGSLSLSGTF